MIRLLCEMSDSSKCLPLLIVFFLETQVSRDKVQRIWHKTIWIFDTFTKLLLCDAGHVISVNLIFSRFTLRQ